MNASDILTAVNAGEDWVFSSRMRESFENGRNP
jgi:hypothetical protein